MQRLETVYLGLGSNLGNRQENILRAIDELKMIGTRVLKVATAIETDPIGPPQGKFLNTVMKGETLLPPQELLIQIKTIEKKLGRVKTVLNGPRIIDIDILLYSNLILNTKTLIIPHPRMWQRDFVLIPLREIEPKIKEPVTK